MSVYISAGHGGRDPGATGFIAEKDYTLKLALELRDYLLKTYQTEVHMARERDVTVSLGDRAAEANRLGVALYLSIHINAGGGYGFESFIWNGAPIPDTNYIRNIIHDHCAAVWVKNGRRDRGKKRGNFFVLRETRMHAVLLEHGFVDDREDARLLQETGFRRELVVAMGDGIAKALSLSRKETGSISDTSDDEKGHSSPEEAGRGVYTVQQGDTLWGIAGKFGLNVEEIIALNRAGFPELEKNPALIRPGQKLIVNREKANSNNDYGNNDYSNNNSSNSNNNNNNNNSNNCNSNNNSTGEGNTEAPLIKEELRREIESLRNRLQVMSDEIKAVKEIINKLAERI